MLKRRTETDFTPLGDPFVPVLSGTMYTAVVTSITVQIGDVLKVQWTSPDCPIMALTPVAYDLGLLGVSNRGVSDISAYLVVINY
jgi:hypothetical protein